MKRQILFSVVIGMLLVACTTKNEPTKNDSHRIRNSETRSFYSELDVLYDEIQTTVIPTLMSYEDIADLMHAIKSGDILEENITYTNILHICQDNHGKIYDLIDSVLSISGIGSQLDNINFQWNTILLDSLVSDMHDSVYITPNYRHRIFYDGYISEHERVALCFLYAINNKIYEDIYGYTILVRDNTHEQYFTTKLLDTTNLSIPWTSPCDIYEINVSDISLFNVEDIEGHIAHEDGNYIPFGSHNDRKDYFLHNLGDYIYYVTSQECLEKKEAAIDDLETNISLAILLAVATSPDTLPVTSLVCLVYYEAKKSYIEKEYVNCLEEADDN